MVSAEEVIGIQKERASRMGEINFATNFRDTRQTYAEIGASCTHSEGRDGVLVFAEDQERLEKAMIDTHKAFERLKKNGSRLKKHPGAVKQATAIVDQQLRNIGKKDRWIETRDLRAKVKEVVTHHVKLPPPTHVTVLVQIPQRLNRSIEFELKEANLPLDSTFAEGADLLQEFLLSELLMRCDTMDIYPSSIETKTVDWDYQLVRGLNNRALWQEKLCLRSTKDWKRMMGSIAQTDQTSTDLPMAVLSCVSARRVRSRNPSLTMIREVSNC